MPGLNYNYNYNYNYAAGGRGGGGGGRAFRERFNTDYYTRLGALSGAIVVPPAASTPPYYPDYFARWDEDLRSYAELDDFIEYIKSPAYTGANGPWRDYYAKIARNSTSGTPRLPPQEMTTDQLNRQIQRMLQLSLEREPRFCEIIDQDDGDGAINYLLGMLQIDPARHRNTIRMVSIGRRIGEYVVMILKNDFNSPRPSQLCPALVPMIDAPATPSFPAGHAVQAYLISYLLAYSLASVNITNPNTPPKIPNHNLPSTGILSQNNRASGLLFDLAYRISQNRVVAGIHYPVDINAGRAVAIQCFLDILQVPSIWTASDAYGLNVRVGREFPRYNNS